MDDKIRIQKWFSQVGLASRREAERWITEGRIAVNGTVIRELGTKIDPESDQITVNGKLVENKAPPRVYWLLNKPDKVLTARDDQFERDTIYDLPKLRNLPYLVSPVGRLDFRTEGLLLLTNDGELANRLCHPKYKVPRSYYVLSNKKLTDAQRKEMTKGVKLKDGMTLPVEITVGGGMKMGATSGNWYDITVYEGRNRLVRRLFEHFEMTVVRLIRHSFGGIRLPHDLKPSEYVQLNAKQIKGLKKATDLEGAGK